MRARDVALNIARAKIETLKSGLSDLKMKRAMAEITELASGMVTQLGGSGAALELLLPARGGFMFEQQRQQPRKDDAGEVLRKDQGLARA